MGETPLLPWRLLGGTKVHAVVQLIVEHMHEIDGSVLTLTLYISVSSHGSDQSHERRKPTQNVTVDTEREFKKLQQEKEVLQQEKENVQRGKDELQQEKEELQREKENVQREKEELQQEKEELQREKENVQREKEELQQEKEELQREKENVQREKEELQQQQDKYQEQIKDHQQQLNGKIYVSPEMCYATGKGLEVAAVGEQATAVVHAVDQDGRECDKPFGKIECELISEANDVVVGFKVEKMNSHYEISYQPTHKGKHQLNIRVEGVHIRGSPFTVAVKTPAHLAQRNLLRVSLVCPMVFHLLALTAMVVKFPIQKLDTPIQTSDEGFQPWDIVLQRLGTPIKIIGGLSRPWGVEVGNNGEIVVVEHALHCVSIFAPNGTKIRRFGTKGSGQGQFNNPRGVAFDSAGNILVVDGSNHRVQKFTAEGKFLKAAGRHGNGTGGHLEFDHPTGIGVNHKNKKVYVCDRQNNRVQILNEDLTFSGRFGSIGGRDFKWTWDVAFDSTGSVYIADGGNHCIQVFTPEGKFLRKFGKEGMQW